MRTTYNLLFVCTGNTCRSPMAEAIARAEIDRRGWRHVDVRSAGVSADSGMPASPQAIRAAQPHGLDLTPHRSRQLDPDLIAWADVILAMSPSHLALIDHLGGESRVALLGDFAAGGDGEGKAVPDPFGGDQAMYDATFLELQSLVTAALDRLTAIVQP